MALTPEQQSSIELKMGSAAYELFNSLYAEADLERLYIENGNNPILTAADALDALADKAASVKEVKIGPITIKLNPESYTASAGRLRKSANRSNQVTSSYMIRTVGVP